jgi:two-component system, OmpR family, KDP operon response regulator KdpE
MASPALNVPLMVGDVTLDVATREVRVQGNAVRLTSTEYRLLEELMRHASTAFPYQYLLQRVWGPEYVSDVHYLRVFVRRLRRKLGDDPEHPRYIQTEWHMGYRERFKACGAAHSRVRERRDRRDTL